MSTQHYEQLLAEVYDWMQGGWENRTDTTRPQFADLGIAPGQPGAHAIDIGAGTGYQAIPLAELGYTVLAVDPSATMLAQLTTHIGDLPITTTEEPFENYTGPPAEVITCMGDTLTHLRSHPHIEQLLQHANSSMTDGGTLVLTFRDGSSALTGDTRFLPIRSDQDRIFTCYLETLDDNHVRVHDILHIRDGDAFTQNVSSYTKLRLRPEWIEEVLQTAGFQAETTPGPGMVTVVARK